MGIKGLHHFLKSKCQTNIRQISLWELKGKTLVVDASIYMYKFRMDGCLIEGIYQMVSLLKHNDITPIFIFDGKPPPEKSNVIRKRILEKKKAEFLYLTMKNTIHPTKEMHLEMNALRKKSLRLSRYDKSQVIKLLSLMGVSYYQCIGESDGICVSMVKCGLAYACMSEDMDMFVYGCPIVLRYLNIIHSTICMYELKGILCTLAISFEEFQHICIISGTDYSSNGIDLQKTVTLFYIYKKTKTDACFLEWMINNHHVKDECMLRRAIEMFNTEEPVHSNNIIQCCYNKEKMQDFLKGYGFIFIPT
jgi:hypothetical protein